MQLPSLFSFAIRARAASAATERIRSPSCPPHRTFAQRFWSSSQALYTPPPSLWQQYTLPSDQSSGAAQRLIGAARRTIAFGAAAVSPPPSASSSSSSSSSSRRSSGGGGGAACPARCAHSTASCPSSPPHLKVTSSGGSLRSINPMRPLPFEWRIRIARDGSADARATTLDCTSSCQKPWPMITIDSLSSSPSPSSSSCWL